MLQICGTALLAGVLGSAALAQVGATGIHLPIQPTPAGPGRGEYERHHRYGTRFDDFLHSHPAIGSDLSKRPDLIRDPKYIKSHPELETYLHHHPGVAEEFHSHPYNFMRRVHKTQ